jgi:hypothetical protein
MVTAMVNIDRLKKKITRLLLHTDTNSKVGWRTFIQKCYRLNYLRRRSPEKCHVVVKIVPDLCELNKTIQERFQSKENDTFFLILLESHSLIMTRAGKRIFFSARKY